MRETIFFDIPADKNLWLKSLKQICDERGLTEKGYTPVGLRTVFLLHAEERPTECKICYRDVEEEWNYCPNCGTEVRFFCKNITAKTWEEMEKILATTKKKDPEVYQIFKRGKISLHLQMAVEKTHE